MVMRYHWGLGIGHTYAHDSRVSFDEPQLEAEDNTIFGSSEHQDCPKSPCDNRDSLDQLQAKNCNSQLESIEVGTSSIY
jgi:hypothetical protein